jgi:hypothetical protein
MFCEEWSHSPSLLRYNTPFIQLRLTFGVSHSITIRKGSKMVLDPTLSLNEIESLLVSERGAIKELMHQICAIPSVDGQIAEVAGRVGQELLRQRYDDVHYDGMGCLCQQRLNNRPKPPVEN